MNEKPSADPSRTGAVWVAGVGAFLLLAAAAVFVAVRWDHVPDAAKLGAVGALTGIFLQVGHRLHRTLPGTARALWHLGALLLPVDVAAVGVHGRLDLAALLLAEGLVCLPAFVLLSRLHQSRVLEDAATVAGLALAAGLGLQTAAPRPIVLAAMALLADREVARRYVPRAALVWAFVAGLTPMIGQDTTRLTAAITGLIAAAVIARNALARESVGLAVGAVVVAVIGVSVSSTVLDADHRFTFAFAATLVLVAELAALLADDDAFWRQPLRGIAVAAEVLAAPAVLLFGLIAVTSASVTRFDFAWTDGATAALVLGLAALVAGERRHGCWPATAALPACTIAAITLGLGDARLSAIAMLGIALVLTVLDRPGRVPVVVALAAIAPVTVFATPALALAAGGLGALIVAIAATRVSDEMAVIVAAGSIAPLGLGTGIAVGAFSPAVVLSIAAASAWLVALVLDTGAATDAGDRLGLVARVQIAVPLFAFGALRPGELLVVALVVAAPFVVDTVRLDDPWLGTGAAVALTMAAGAFSLDRGYDVPSTGVVVAAFAACSAGLALVVGHRWLPPFALGAVAAGGAGLVMAAGDATAFGAALLVLGSAVVAVGAALSRAEVAYAGAGVATLGIWLELATAHVAASEPYVAPVAAILLAAGIGLQRGGASSWQAYGGPVAMMTGTALAERLFGNGAGHALIAGVVAVAAVIAGGRLRLAAPLVIGTGVLVVLTGYESLGVTAGVPTWGWLALAGSVLLGAGVAMERRDAGPLETGRRFVDVLNERFA